MRCERLWRNARLATMSGAGIVDDGMIACQDGAIVYAGPRQGAPALDAAESIDAEGRWITPGLIDCHTHLIFAGDRSAEFESRLAGASYEEIARTGGGIVSTMTATRAASEAELVESGLTRLDELLAEGVTTVEVKSGYGLSRDDELKQLRAAKALAGQRAVWVTPTFLGAHTAPPEYRDRPDAYIDLVCNEMIPAVAAGGLADAVDAFCETVGFTPDQVGRVFVAARAHGLKIKVHAEQLSNQGGAALAASFGALSADHLEYLDEAGAGAMAEARTTAVLLPGAYYFTRQTLAPPIDILRPLGVPMALATDCNPGTSPLTSPLLAMNMAATCFGLTVAECLAGFTLNAAKALGLESEIGTLESGKRCDLAIWNIDRPAELVYHLSRNPLHSRVWGGR